MGIFDLVTSIWSMWKAFISDPSLGFVQKYQHHKVENHSSIMCLLGVYYFLNSRVDLIDEFPRPFWVVISSWKAQKKWEEQVYLWDGCKSTN